MKKATEYFFRFVLPLAYLATGAIILNWIGWGSYIGGFLFGGGVGFAYAEYKSWKQHQSQ